MIQLIINISDIGDTSVEISSAIEGDIENATDYEIVAMDEVLNCIDEMIDDINEEDAQITVKGILDKLGKP